MCMAQYKVQQEVKQFKQQGSNTLSYAFHTMELTLTFMCT